MNCRLTGCLLTRVVCFACSVRCQVHDFTRDPVLPIIEGNIMRADRTTLGADDGIGVAASMAILEIDDADKEFVHGPLEAVFTVSGGAPPRQHARSSSSCMLDTHPPADWCSLVVCLLSSRCRSTRRRRWAAPRTSARTCSSRR